MSRPEKSLRSSLAVRSDSSLSFADAFEDAPHAMALVDADGTLICVNRALCHMLGFDRDDLTGCNISAITHPDDLETEWEQRQRLARTDIGRYELNQRFLGKLGETVWVRLSVSATRRAFSNVVHFVVQAEAVPSPRCARTNEPDDEWLRRFGDATLSAMHEIGNTLTPLMVNTELIVEQTRSEPIRDLANEVFKAARRIAFTLRRLRKIDETRAVAYLGDDRLLDLRMVPPKTEGDAHAVERAEGRSLDSEVPPRQN
jgi:PAS domain S-box-containing protein